MQRRVRNKQNIIGNATPGVPVSPEQIASLVRNVKSAAEFFNANTYDANYFGLSPANWTVPWALAPVYIQQNTKALPKDIAEKSAPPTNAEIPGEVQATPTDAPAELERDTA